MKSCILLAFLIFSCHLASQAQVIESPREHRKKKTVDYETAAVFYPFAVATDHFRIGIEHRTSDKVGLRGILNFGYGEDNVFYNADDFISFGGELQARYYPTPGMPALFVGGFASARSINITRADGSFYDINGNLIHTYNEYSAQAFGFGIITGLQYQIANVFIFDLYIGAGPNIPTGDYKTGASFSNNIWGYRKGMRYNGGLNFGIILFK